VRAAIAAVAALALLGAAAPAAASSLRADELRVDYLTNPAGIDDRTPSLSWELHAHGRERRQRA
jgi:hypothetical protein